jgi:hypothetical protein
MNSAWKLSICMYIFYGEFSTNDTWEDKLEDAKILKARDIRSRKSKNRHGQKKKRLKKHKQWLAKHYTEI